ncbi:hypothetical protein NXT08_23910 (plasmid) [Rhodococcus pyridinivorans]|uniref:hypothetical protein n=1 Tax=Rhodococcus TaxID=1827 RepID=UPI0007DA2164|nr:MULTISPECIES: hypothetical protein [Rhodococcus]MCT7294036.1 hypothetical protein [Rhodococcus sp. PAE-6]QXU56501.1 hypothetical protein KXC42_25365 [Rhodococcus sp. LW-XY12]UQB75868.1 hypothetical protein KI427_27035 [Rhodococcus ruber]UVT27602.1 hypothetical protein NXT08_23910 [Rhodococcus pyridinivorans]WML66233.1 hypothetical protein QNA09_28480 [Rhodococcus sp. AH-ZY2]
MARSSLPLRARTASTALRRAHAARWTSTLGSAGWVAPRQGAPNTLGRRQKVTTATALRLDRIVDELVTAFRASNGAAAVSSTVVLGVAPEIHDRLICAYLLDKALPAPTGAQVRVEIKREGPRISVQVTLEPASTTTRSAPTQRQRRHT